MREIVTKRDSGKDLTPLEINILKMANFPITLKEKRIAEEKDFQALGSNI